MRKATVSFVMPVRPSSCPQGFLSKHVRIFWNSIEKIEVTSEYDKNNE